jgi:hypothetical protein
MTKYELRSDEAVLLQAEQVQRRDGKRGGSDGLILTNVHLIVLDRGVLGRAEAEYLPLSQVKVVNDQVQALATKSREGHPQLEVFFLDRHEAFTFQSGGRRAVVKWANAINLVVSGRGGEVRKPANLALPGTERVVETLRDTVGQVARSLRNKKN